MYASFSDKTIIGKPFTTLTHLDFKFFNFFICCLSNPKYWSNKYFKLLPPNPDGNIVILFASFNINFVSCPAVALWRNSQTLML